jgi:hypothetical protein
MKASAVLVLAGLFFGLALSHSIESLGIAFLSKVEVRARLLAFETSIASVVDRVRWEAGRCVLEVLVHSRGGQNADLTN